MVHVSGTTVRVQLHTISLAARNLAPAILVRADLAFPRAWMRVHAGDPAIGFGNACTNDILRVSGLPKPQLAIGLQAYLGSESESGSGSEEDGAGGRAGADVDRYRQLLLAGDDATAPHRKGGKDWGAQAAGEEGEEGKEQDGDDNGSAEVRAPLLGSPARAVAGWMGIPCVAEVLLNDRSGAAPAHCNTR